MNVEDTTTPDTFSYPAAHHRDSPSNASTSQGSNDDKLMYIDHGRKHQKNYTSRHRLSSDNLFLTAVTTLETEYHQWNRIVQLVW